MNELPSIVLWQYELTLRARGLERLLKILSKNTYWVVYHIQGIDEKNNKKMFKRSGFVRCLPKPHFWGGYFFKQEGRKTIEQLKEVYAKTIRNGTLSKIDD